MKPYYEFGHTPSAYDLANTGNGEAYLRYIARCIQSQYAWGRRHSLHFTTHIKGIELSVTKGRLVSVVDSGLPVVSMRKANSAESLYLALAERWDSLGNPAPVAGTWAVSF